MFSPLKSSAFSEIDLKLMSFNVRYGTAKDGKNSWTHRRELVFDLLKKNQTDIFCLQEALHFQIEEIFSEIKNYSVIAKGRDDGKQSGEHNAIFYNPKRFKILKSDTFWFSQTPSVPGSKHWGNKQPRICTWSHFFDKTTSLHFFIYNVHLDHRSTLAKRKSADLLAQKFKRHKKDNIPVILLGDFNAGEKSEIIQYFKGKACLKDFHQNDYPLEDTFRKLHPKALGGTFHMFFGNRIGPKLDYILAPKESTVLNCSIIRTNVNGKYPSDHFPLYSHIVLKV